MTVCLYIIVCGKVSKCLLKLYAGTYVLRIIRYSVIQVIIQILSERVQENSSIERSEKKRKTILFFINTLRRVAHSAKLSDY